MKKLILIIVTLFMFTTVEAGHFAPKSRTYNHNSYRKSKPPKKANFVCVRHKKINRKGMMR